MLYIIITLAYNRVHCGCIEANHWHHRQYKIYDCQYQTGRKTIALIRSNSVTIPILRGVIHRVLYDFKWSLSISLS